MVLETSFSSFKKMYHRKWDKSSALVSASENNRTTEQWRESSSFYKAHCSYADAVSQVSSTSRMTCYWRFSAPTNHCDPASCSCGTNRELQLSKDSHNQRITYWKKLKIKRENHPSRKDLETICDMESNCCSNDFERIFPRFRTSNLCEDRNCSWPSIQDLFSLVKSFLDLCGKGVLLLLTVIAHLCNSFLRVSWLGSGSALSPRLLLCRFVVLLSPWLFQISNACSTRPSPKPRPPRPYWRVDETLPKFNCTKDYEELYCLNKGSCFMQMNIHDVPTPYCMCFGYYGRRCEYLDIEDRHLPTIQRQRIETAAISVAVTLLIMIAFLLSVTVYVYRRRMKYPRTVYDTTDSIPDRPFSIRRRDQLGMRRTQRPESEDVAGFEPSSSAGFQFIDEERKASASVLPKYSTVTGRAEVHVPARSSVV